MRVGWGEGGGGHCLCGCVWVCSVSCSFQEGGMRGGGGVRGALFVQLCVGVSSLSYSFHEGGMGRGGRGALFVQLCVGVSSLSYSFHEGGMGRGGRGHCLCGCVWVCLLFRIHSMRVGWGEGGGGTVCAAVCGCVFSFVFIP